MSCQLLETEQAIFARSEVSGTGKTGFEMEALTAVSAALLCVYDLVKAIDPTLVLSNIQLVEKEGGKSGHWINPAAALQPSPKSDSLALAGVSAEVIVVSDRVSRGEATDSSGESIREFLASRGAKSIELTVVPDEKEKIELYSERPRSSDECAW